MEKTVSCYKISSGQSVPQSKEVQGPFQRNIFLKKKPSWTQTNSYRKTNQKTHNPQTLFYELQTTFNRPQSTLKIPKYWIKSYGNVYVYNTKTLE